MASFCLRCYCVLDCTDLTKQAPDMACMPLTKQYATGFLIATKIKVKCE